LFEEAGVVQLLIRITFRRYKIVAIPLRISHERDYKPSETCPQEGGHVHRTAGHQRRLPLSSEPSTTTQIPILRVQYQIPTSPRNVFLGANFATEQAAQLEALPERSYPPAVARASRSGCSCAGALRLLLREWLCQGLLLLSSAFLELEVQQVM
jgi:hypothetical protein